MIASDVRAGTGQIVFRRRRTTIRTQRDALLEVIGKPHGQGACLRCCSARGATAVYELYTWVGKASNGVMCCSYAASPRGSHGYTDLENVWAA